MALSFAWFWLGLGSVCSRGVPIRAGLAPMMAMPSAIRSRHLPVSIAMRRAASVPAHRLAPAARSNRVRYLPPVRSPAIARLPIKARGLQPPKLLRLREMTGSVSHGGMAGWSAQGGTPVVVANGETADTIANRYGIPREALIHTNGFSSSAEIRPGTRLVNSRL